MKIRSFLILAVGFIPFLPLPLSAPVHAQSPSADKSTSMIAPATPPVAKKIPKTMENFGDKRVDDYFWLREKTNPEVIDYLKAENVYTQSVLGGLKEFQ